MEKTEVLKKYEVVLIVDALLSSEEKDNICKNTAEAVNKIGGKVINSHVWLEKQKFTFDIKKKKEGTYYLVNIEMPSGLVAKLRTALKLNESILRFEVVKTGK
jgi:small subunit ribosomal protein S6